MKPKVSYKNQGEWNEKAPSLESAGSIEAVARLIKSLSMAQKRDFKKHTKFWGNSDTKYIRLFDFINKTISLNKKDDSLLDLDLEARKAGFKPKEINVVSSYLYSKILESMRLIPEETTLLNQLNSLIQDIAFLFNKSLFIDCQRLIKEAKKLSYSIDKPLYTLEALFWDRKIEEKLNSKGVLGKIEAITTEENIILEKLTKFIGFNALVSDLILKFQEEKPLSNDIEETMTSIIHNYENYNSYINSPRVHIKILTAITLYYNIKYNSEVSQTTTNYLEEAKKTMHQIIEIYNKNKALKEDESSIFHGIVDSYIIACIKMNQIDEVNKYKSILTNVRNNNFVLNRIHYSNIIYNIKNEQFLQAKKYIEESALEKITTKDKMLIAEHRLLVLYYACAQVYFILEEYRKAIFWLDKVLLETRNDNRPEIGDVARMINGISLLEIGLYHDATSTKSPFLDHLYNRFISELNTNDERLTFNIFKVKLIELVRDVVNQSNQQVQETNLELVKDMLNKSPILNTYGIVLAWIESKVHNSKINYEIRKYIN